VKIIHSPPTANDETACVGRTFPLEKKLLSDDAEKARQRVDARRGLMTRCAGRNDVLRGAEIQVACRQERRRLSSAALPKLSTALPCAA